VAQQVPVEPARPKEMLKAITAGLPSETTKVIASIDTTPEERVSAFINAYASKLSQALTLHNTTRTVKPPYHTPWKPVHTNVGHLGWVRNVAVEPGNTWFATGAGDCIIKIWNLASGELWL
jgi:pleiotropic regulator 1